MRREYLGPRFFTRQSPRSHLVGPVGFSAGVIVQRWLPVSRRSGVRRRCDNSHSPQPGVPHGIKSVGEIGLVPTAGAVAAALREYEGVWHTELPMRNPSNRERADAWA